MLEEGLEMCRDVHGEEAPEAAQALFDLAVEMCNEITIEHAVSPDIGVDDVAITRRRKADGTIAETVRPMRGTIKELVRGLRTTVPVSKLVHADSMVREYLLYSAISIVAALGQPLALPAGMTVREYTIQDWLERGRKLAAETPHKFTLPPDSVMDALITRLGRA